MTKAVTGRTLCKRATKRDQVLLVNPPVFETRYSWLRWNQPLDLLRIGGYLKREVECNVELFDFMLPDERGRVVKQGLTGSERYHQVGQDEFAHTYPMWRFGQPFTALRDWLVARRAAGQRDPTQVWITSLCSYWFPSVLQTCNFVRQWLLDAEIVLVGNYPRFMLEHALDFCDADFVLKGPVQFADKGTPLALYGDRRPPFVSVTLNPKTAVRSIKEAVAAGVYHVAVFEDDICRGGAEPLREIVEKTKSLHRHLRFHAICGLHPDRVTRDLADLFAERTFAELHFEQCDLDGELKEAAYEQCRAYLAEAGIDLTDGDKTSGFVWIGRPGETLEGIVRRSFSVLGTFGSLILKPFTPTPGTDAYDEHKEYVEAIAYDDLSPHRFPFAEYNEITRDEYHDLYRMAAFLNEKVRNRAFDLMNGSLGADLLRNSLRREVWNLEPMPLSIID